jgi:hypothetical protein
VNVVLAERPRSILGRAWSAVLAAWGAFIGVLPHVLHHVGPLAGAALLAGAGGTALFATIGFVAAIPFLIRLQRKFRTWRAPAIALAVFAAAFSLSSFVIGPALSGGSESSPPSQPGVEQLSGHYSHHH